MIKRLLRSFFFFFNDTATTEIYTLSLHDALPIWVLVLVVAIRLARRVALQQLRPATTPRRPLLQLDRKSTRLNSSHGYISYAVFCLKKKTNKHVSGSHPLRAMLVDDRLARRPTYLCLLATLSTA